MRLEGLGLMAEGVRLRAWGFGALGWGPRVYGAGFRFQGLRSGVWGWGLRDMGMECRGLAFEPLPTLPSQKPASGVHFDDLDSELACINRCPVWTFIFPMMEHGRIAALQHLLQNTKN